MPEAGFVDSPPSERGASLWLATVTPSLRLAREDARYTGNLKGHQHGDELKACPT